MKRRNFTKGLFAAIALMALPATYIYKQVKKRFIVKTYTITLDYNPKDRTIYLSDWVHKSTEEIEI